MGCKIVVNGSRGVLELPLIVIKWSFIVILCCRVVAAKLYKGLNTYLKYPFI